MIEITPIQQLSVQELELLRTDPDIKSRVQHNYPLVCPHTFRKIVVVRHEDGVHKLRIDFDEAAEFIKTGYIKP